MIKLLLVDDQSAVRKGLRMRMSSESDMVVVGESASGEEALGAVNALHPDVVLMDVELPQMDGIAATQALRQTHACPAVIILTIHDDAITRRRAQAAGAAAFVTKSGGDDGLLAAIRQAHDDK